MIDWCESYLHWLRTGKFGQKEAEAKNNHGTWYDAQVVTLALYVGQDSVAREVLRTEQTTSHRRADRNRWPTAARTCSKPFVPLQPV